MTKFLVSARKYRPQTFTEMVSQDHVGETLRNAIKFDRLAHAYLFCGPRGVGKTSAARILAKTVNCSTPIDQRSNLDPCRKCESCVSFEEGRSLNVIEIDAASNNGVDDIRALRETVRVPPQMGVKKVYIIDEVHMLSKQAFNALLKTLEEPPPYVLFLFATTEPQKVLPTILSRCQRFDFRRISIPDIVTQLRKICDVEGIEADDASLRLIARKGDGALRDAFSTFDQAVLLCGKKLEYRSLVEALGTVDVDVYFETTGQIAEHDKAALLRRVEHLVTHGFDIHEFLLGLTDHMRNVLVALTTGSTDLIEADVQTAERYVDQGALFSEMDLLRHLIVLDGSLDVLRRSVNPRLRLELALLKMASLGKSADLQQLLQHLQNPSSPAPEPTKASAPAPAKAPAPAPTKASTPASAKAPAPAPTKASTPASAKASAPAPEPTKASAPAPTKASAPAPTKASAPESAKASAPASAKASAPAPESAKASAPEVKLAEPESTKVDLKPASGSSEGFFGSPAITSQPERFRKGPNDDRTGESDAAPGSEEAVVPLSEIETAWGGYVTAVMKDRIHVGALLQHASPLSITGKVIEISVPDIFHEKLLGSETAYLADKLATTLSLSPAPEVRVVLSEADTPAETEPELDIGERIQKLKGQNPIIAALIDNFGGEVVW